MKIVAVVGFVVVAILGVGYFTTSNDSADVQNVATETEQTDASRGLGTETEPVAPAPASAPDSTISEPTETALIKTEKELEPPATVTNIETPVPGSYENYSASALASSEAETRVLFFHATWCPSCRALENDILQNQASIPEGVAIFKADYDTETQLKRDFGVVRQHSVVILDTHGVQQGNVTHPATLSQLLANL